MSRHLGTSTVIKKIQYRAFRLDLTIEQLVAVGLNSQPVGYCLKVILPLHDGIPQVGVIDDDADGTGNLSVDSCKQGVSRKLLVVETDTRDRTLRLRFRLRKRNAEALRNVTEDPPSASAIDPR